MNKEFLNSMKDKLTKEKNKRDLLIAIKNDYANNFDELTTRDVKAAKYLVKSIKELNEKIGAFEVDVEEYEKKIHLVEKLESLKRSKATSLHDKEELKVFILTAENEVKEMEEFLDIKYSNESEEIDSNKIQDVYLKKQETDVEESESNEKTGGKTALKVLCGIVAFLGIATAIHHCSKSDEVVLEDVPDAMEDNLPDVTSEIEENIEEDNEVYDVNVFDDINDSLKLESRANLIQTELFRVVEGTDFENNIKSVYTTEVISNMINFYNDGYIADFQGGDSLEYHNLVNGLTNLENELNVVMPLYLFVLDNTMEQSVAKQIYNSRIIMMEAKEEDLHLLAIDGVSELAKINYETFIMPGTNGAISVNYFTTAGSKAFNLKYLLASNALAEEVDGKHEAYIIDVCGKELKYCDLYNAINEGKAFENGGDRLVLPANYGNDGCFEITYLSSYSMGAEQEILVKNNQELKLQK